ncbi:MAG: ComF family protein, partial [Pseudomonadota bacterium]
GAAAVVYEGAGRKLVLSLKHGDRLDVSPLVSGWMAARGGPLVDAADLIAPVPLHWRRLIQRRYNQAGELARDLAAQSDAAGALALDLLVRTRRTAVMDGKTRAERITNVASAFEVDRRWKGRLSGKTVLLVDDVMTTGATLSACAEILRQGGAAHVNVLVFARVARGDWPT